MLKSDNGLLSDDGSLLSGKSITDLLSFFALLVYFITQPFNGFFHTLALVGSLLDFTWAGVFLTFSFICAAQKKRALSGEWEIKIVVLWLLYLCASYLGSSDETMPEFGLIKTYAARWLVQTVPLFLLVAIRGLTRTELKVILSAFVLMMPLSIVSAYLTYDIRSFAEAQQYADAGFGISYNTYVPYTTYSCFACLYLMNNVKSKGLQIGFGAILIVVGLFILANPSRQSLLFVILGGMAVLVIQRQYKTLLVILVAALTLAWLTSYLGWTDRVVARYFSEKTFESARPELMADGIASIGSAEEWLFGGGLSLDLDSLNPHSSYVFSLMRCGLIGTVLMFLPFVLGFLLTIALILKHAKEPWFDRSLAALVTLGILFTLFHSFFGYPQLDSLGAPVVWFGLALWVAFHRDVKARQKALRRRGRSWWSGSRRPTSAIGTPMDVARPAPGCK